MFKNLLLVTGAAWIVTSGSAATFSVSPAHTVFDSSNTITLAVGGIASGQSVLLQQFADDNGNGLVDPGEMLLMSVPVFDGEAPTFPPSSTLNRSGDDDGATNGAISKVLRLGALAERLRGAGSYVFRLSTADASFSPISRPFVIATGSHTQAVAGTVLSAGVPVPSALVALLGGGEDSQFIAGGISDENGSYVIPAPAGEYGVIALKAGYVFDFATAPGVSLAPGVTNTQNVSLLAATRTISGSVVSALTSNGIGGLQIFAQSQAGLAALAFTDADGDFHLPVTGDAWELEVSELSAAVAGYGHAEAHADTTSGHVAGVSLVLPRAFGRLQLVFFFPSGSFDDNTNGAIHFPTRLAYYFAHYDIEDANAPTNVSFSGPPGSGLDNNPSEYHGGQQGGWSASFNSRSLEVPAYPPGGTYVVNYKGYPQTFVVPDPQAQNRQVVIVPRAILNAAGDLQEVRWLYRNSAGSLIGPPSYMRSVELRVDGPSGQLYSSEASPDASSHTLGFPVAWADVRSLQMVYEDDLGNQYVAFWTRASQRLQIHFQLLPGAPVGQPYAFLFVASGGRPPYSWAITQGSLPAGISFAQATGELTGTPQANGRADFSLRVTDDAGQSEMKNFSLILGSGAPPRLEMRPTGVPGEFGLRLIGNPGHDYSLQYSTGLPVWSTLLTTNLGSSGFLDFVDRSATNQLRLYRLLLNP